MKVLAAFLFVLAGTTQVLGLACPNGWNLNGQSCYLYMTETYNWFDAKVVCNIIGGYLAEDSSSSTHQFLTGLIQGHGANYVWLGLNDFVEENQFMWTHSGTRPNPTFWLPSEPQDSNGEEDCVTMHSGGWADTNCEDWRHSFICEKLAS